MVVLWRISAIGVVALGVALGGCASKDSGSGGSNVPAKGGSGTSGAGSGTSGSGGKTGGNDTAVVGSDLTILFSPMYSGYDGVHTFKIPAIVQGIDNVKWSASDVSYVDLADDPVTHGVMITTRKAGDVKIIARAGNLSGSADLHITQYSMTDCDLGDNRYHNDVGIMTNSNGQASIANIPNNASCANCHGDGAQFLDIQHTPEQTGGYSDMDLMNIFSMGFKPNGTMFHTQIPPMIYQQFHTWQATDEEKKGLVCYLRAFEPKSQGMINFGGRGGGNAGGAGRGAAGTGAAGTAGTAGAAGH